MVLACSMAKKQMQDYKNNKSKTIQPEKNLSQGKGQSGPKRPKCSTKKGM